MAQPRAPYPRTAQLRDLEQATSGDPSIRLAKKRMSRLRAGKCDVFEISPNLSAGIGLVGGGASTTLVDDLQTAYADLSSHSLTPNGAKHNSIHLSPQPR